MSLFFAITTIVVIGEALRINLQFYNPNQVLPILVNSMSSRKGVLPYPHYSVKTCAPTAEVLERERQRENLGEILWGDRIEPSLYSVRVMQNVTCQEVCTVQYSRSEMAILEKRIDQEYRVNMMLDNLPVAVDVPGGKRTPKVLTGYPLGTPKHLTMLKKTYINNHLHFYIRFNDLDSTESDDITIVGFSVAATSAAHNCKKGGSDVTADAPPVSTDVAEVTYTYSVTWIESSDIRWSTRWDIYLKGEEDDNRIHWISITNSILIIVFLALMVGMILIRSLRRDLLRYNAQKTPEESQEETGWKLVHGDVFRNPPHAVLLASIVGSGVQVLCMCLIALVFALVGTVSPATRGTLLSALIFIYVLLGSVAGFVSGKLFMLFNEVSWRNVFLTGLLVPGSTMVMFLVLNMVSAAKHASSSLALSTVVVLFALWFLCSLPLVIVGAQIAFKSPRPTVPCPVNPVPRLIPTTSAYSQSWGLVLSSGVLPFGAAFIELVYIMSSFWQGRIYYVFGFLGAVFGIVAITCVEVAIVIVYFQLCYEDYRWWWNSFAYPASSGGFLWVYSLYYLLAMTTIRQPTSVALYLGYMTMLSGFFALCTGTVGFLAGFAFVRRIYSSLKID